MPGFHADPDGNIYEQSRLKAASIAVVLAEAKNLPGINSDFIADYIVRFMELRDLYAFVHGADEAVTKTVHGQIVEMIDDQAILALLSLFAQIGGVRLDHLSDYEVCNIFGKLVDGVKQSNPADAITYVWPPLATVEQWANDRLLATPCAQPGGLAKVEAALLALIVERP